MGGNHVGSILPASSVLVKVHESLYLVIIPSKLPNVLQELIGAHMGGV